MLTRETARTMVAEAISLETLLAALIAIESDRDDARVEDRLADTAEDWIDYSSLPSYGGATPRSTCEVWSWDESSMMVGCTMPFEIVPRSDRTDTEEV